MQVHQRRLQLNPDTTCFTSIFTCDKTFPHLIRSAFLRDILYKLIEGHEWGSHIRAQVQLMEESEYDYTGMGVLVGFSHDDEIGQYLVPERQEISISGVDIKSAELNGDGAEATLHLSDGRISYLEIFAYSGLYPEHELTDYTIVRRF